MAKQSLIELAAEHQGMTVEAYLRQAEVKVKLGPVAAGRKMPLAARRHMQKVLREVERERHKQHAKWGAQPNPDATARSIEWWLEFGMTADTARQACQNASEKRGGPGSCFLHILIEEVCEAMEEACAGNTDNLRKELVQVAAVCVKWIEQMDAR